MTKVMHYVLDSGGSLSLGSLHLSYDQHQNLTVGASLSLGRSTSPTISTRT